MLPTAAFIFRFSVLIGSLILLATVIYGLFFVLAELQYFMETRKLNRRERR